MARKNGMSSHQSHASQTDVWLTPPWVFEQLEIKFDLDPCCIPHMPWRTASTMFADGHTDGLTEPWHGRVWLNPPYSEVGRWMSRMSKHGDGIAMVFARTETKWWFSDVWNRASTILFMRSRPHFHHADGQRAKGNSGCPVALVSYGSECASLLCKSKISGCLVRNQLVIN